MKAPPPGWPRLSASVCYRDTRAAIDFLVDAFGFEVRTRVVNERGAVQHAELTLGEAVIMPFDESPEADRPWKR